MKLLRGLTMALAFGLEIAMVSAFAGWGVSVAPTGWMQAILAISASAAVIAVWGLLLAPRAEHRLSRPWRLIAEAGEAIKDQPRREQNFHRDADFGFEAGGK